MYDASIELVYEMPQAILNWYNFKRASMVLLVYNENSNLMEMLQKKGLIVTCASETECVSETFIQRFEGAFDYVVAINTLESSKSPVEILDSLRRLIKEEGIMLLGTDNRLGIRYFCGDKDPYTERFFDGIEGYRRQNKEQQENRRGRCYSKAEIKEFLARSGWNNYKVYSVFPDLKAPQLIFAENYQVKEQLSIRYFPQYNFPDTVFVKEEFIYSDLIKNNLFYEMANAFLFECSISEVHSNVLQVTLSMDRGHENSLATIICDNGKAIKRALYAEGNSKLEILQHNMNALKKRGITVVEGEITENGIYVMPRMDAKLGNVYLYELLESNPEEFIKEMDYFRDLILKSSEEIDEIYDKNDLGIILKRGYIDMVPLNSFRIDNDFVFFDQEFVMDNYPANAIVYRAIAIVYEDDPRRKAIIPEEFFWKRYGLENQISRLQELSAKFTKELRHQNELEVFRKERYRDEDKMFENRLRMDYSEREYEELFYNPVANLDDKKLFIFGAGRFAEKFIAMYQWDYTIEAVLDNNVERWGQNFEGYPIKSPSVLYELNPGEYKVVICIKDYDSVLRQLQNMGVANISIYQRNKVYPGRQACAIQPLKEEKKKYHIGYIAGVFDLYHVGHLNMFRRAKELCDYLIVGVVTDKGVREFKGTEPFIPFEERVELVRSCRYVDEVVEIPYFYRTTIEAFEKYHFDVQFSGSDYENDPGWLEHKRYLEKHGSTLIFFPYTQQTSSTKIKGLIDKGLV